MLANGRKSRTDGRTVLVSHRTPNSPKRWCNLQAQYLGEFGLRLQFSPANDSDLVLLEHYESRAAFGADQQQRTVATLALLHGRHEIVDRFANHKEFYFKRSDGLN